MFNVEATPSSTFVIQHSTFNILLLNLPSRKDVEAVHDVLRWTLERLRRVNLDRDVAEKNARPDTDAHDGNALGRVGLELQLRMLAAVPGRADVDERFELGRDGRRVDQAELLRAEERESHLHAACGDARSDDAVVDGTCSGRRAGRHALID